MESLLDWFLNTTNIPMRISWSQWLRQSSSMRIACRTICLLPRPTAKSYSAQVGHQSSFQPISFPGTPLS
ncbi:unnamed protein product [Dovyalis caffra]|uniref:Uncharacterized protein n=1 Tax=Dovyalis caffra TaxID=77055 RepID=A0AAV1SRR0_9ROSI|nr:unnamed protein product [Dovyalis caffra]